MDPATILSILGAVGAAIGTAITAMWKKLSADHDAVMNRCAKLEERDDARDTEVAEMKSTLAVFQACPTENCGAREAMRRAATFNLSKKRHETK